MQARLARLKRCGLRPAVDRLLESLVWLLLRHAVDRLFHTSPRRPLRHALDRLFLGFPWIFQISPLLENVWRDFFWMVFGVVAWNGAG